EGARRSWISCATTRGGRLQQGRGGGGCPVAVLERGRSTGRLVLCQRSYGNRSARDLTGRIPCGSREGLCDSGLRRHRDGCLAVLLLDDLLPADRDDGGGSGELHHR